MRFIPQFFNNFDTNTGSSESSVLVASCGSANVSLRCCSSQGDYNVHGGCDSRGVATALETKNIRSVCMWGQQSYHRLLLGSPLQIHGFAN